MTKSRVEACIESVMSQHPGDSDRAQLKFYEAVHQELAPLARQIEKELRLARTELSQRDEKERDLTRCLKDKLADAQQERQGHINHIALLSGSMHKAEYEKDAALARVKALKVALEHCLDWLPEDCSAASEAAALLEKS